MPRVAGMTSHTLLARLLGAALLCSLALLPGTSAGAAARPAAPAVVVYPGDGVEVWRASGDLRRLRATTPAFRAFVEKRLDRMWKGWLDADPACAHSPLVVVKTWTRDGFARIVNEGTFRHGPGTARCAGGGAQRIYAVRDGRWRAVLGAQEPFACDDLRRYEVPDVVGGPECLDADGELVDYRLAG